MCNHTIVTACLVQLNLCGS